MSGNSFRLSAQHYSVLSAYLPSDLTSKQIDKVIAACEIMAAQVWTDAMSAEVTRKYLYVDAFRADHEALAVSEHP